MMIEKFRGRFGLSALAIFAFFILLPSFVFSFDDVHRSFSITYPLGELEPSYGDIIVRDKNENILRISSREDEPNVFGIVAEKPALVFRTDPDNYPVMRFGQTYVNVILEGRIPINKGDYITTSDVPGHGRRVVFFHRYVVGVALESFGVEDAIDTVQDSAGRVYRSGQVPVDVRIGFLYPGMIFVSGEAGQSDDFTSLEFGVQDMFAENLKTVRNIGDAVLDGFGEFFKNDAGITSTRVVTTVGVVVGFFMATSGLLLAPFTVFEIFMLPLRLWTSLLSFFGIRRRSRPWGVVYDSITKQPIDPAYVVLEDENGNEVKMSITDIDGRYGFLVDQGLYKIKASKTNYIFPSEKLKGKMSDDIYNNLYFGELFKVGKKGGVVDKNIPMDPEDFDWNEFVKLNKNILTYYSYIDFFKAVIFKWFFYIGFLISIIALWLSPDTYNVVIVTLYIFLFLLRLMGLKPRHYGRLIKDGDGTPLSFAIVRVCLPKSGKVISSATCDKYGRYFALVTNGTYYVKAERKKGENQYETVFVSETFDVKKGIINRTFRV